LYLTDLSKAANVYTEAAPATVPEPAPPSAQQRITHVAANVAAPTTLAAGVPQAGRVAATSPPIDLLSQPAATAISVRKEDDGGRKMVGDGRSVIGTQRATAAYRTDPSEIDL
jgi:hypothetical protein